MAGTSGKRTGSPGNGSPGALPRGTWIVLLAALLPYLALPTKPLLIDAPLAVLQNPVLRDGKVGDLFSHDFWGAPTEAKWGTRSYRPLVNLTWWLQHRLYGTDETTSIDPETPRNRALATWLHLEDMGLHALGALLFVLLLLELLPDPRWAVPGGVFFAVHPLLSEAVSCTVGRADLMASVGFLGALVLHLRADRSRRPWVLEGGAMLLLAATFLCKEYAVAFPFLLLGVEIALGLARGWPEGAVRRRKLAVLGIAFALLAAYLGLRLALFGALGGVPMLGVGDTPLYGKPLSVRWATAAWLLLLGARLLVLPVRLTYFYSYGTIPIAESFLDPRALGGVALVAVLVAVSIHAAARRRDPVPAIASLLFLLPLGPSLNTVSIAGVLFAERFFYLPVAGFALLVTGELARLVRTNGGRRAALVALGVVSVVFAGMTALRVQDWSSPESIARAGVRAYPRASGAWLELGLALAARGEDAEAAEAFEKSLEECPQSPFTWKNYAVALMRLGRYEESVAAWRRCLEMSPPDLAPLWRGLGKAELLAGHPDRAVRALGRAYQLRRRDAERQQDPRVKAVLEREADELRVIYQQALLRLAQQRLREARAGEARELARRAVHLGSLPAPGLFLAGQVLHRAGYEEEAKELFQEALAADPDLLRKKHEVAVELDRQGKHAEAAEAFREILAVRPDHVSTLFNLGRNLLLAGRPEEAIAYLEKGLARREDPRARRLLEEARRRARRVPRTSRLR